MSAIRLTKTALVAAIAAFFTLVAFGNLTDYDSNWQFVRHDSTLTWRAITSPALQSVGYWLIIAWEAATAVVLWIGTARLLRARSNAAFAAVKSTAVAGLGLGFLLYAFGFIVVGGEWFAMWQSETWNGQQSAFGFIAMIGLVLIVLIVPEAPAATGEPGGRVGSGRQPS